MFNSAAFVPTLPSGALVSSARSSWLSGAPCRQGKTYSTRVVGRVSSRRVRGAARPRVLSMSDEQQQQTTAQSTVGDDDDEKKDDESAPGTGSGFNFEAPKVNTTAFSDFVENAQARVVDVQDRIQNIDSDKLVADSVDSGKGLMDNFLAGEWLNRGELYGAFQIALVLVLFKKPVTMDVLVALITGPLMIVSGAAISGKALWDLGIKNVSIWPAPVPNGTLKTDGLYQVVRHPIYSGLLLSSVGFAVATHSPARLAICALLAVLLAKKINVEEEFLAKTYADYEDYASQVPFKLVPKVY